MKKFPEKKWKTYWTNWLNNFSIGNYNFNPEYFVNKCKLSHHIGMPTA